MTIGRKNARERERKIDRMWYDDKCAKAPRIIHTKFIDKIEPFEFWPKMKLDIIWCADIHCINICALGDCVCGPMEAGESWVRRIVGAERWKQENQPNRHIYVYVLARTRTHLLFPKAWKNWNETNRIKFNLTVWRRNYLLCTHDLQRSLPSHRYSTFNFHS